MANADPMGLGAAGGAASIAPTLESLLKQRLMEEAQRLQLAKAIEEQRQAQAMESYRQQSLTQDESQFGRSHGLAREQFGQTQRVYDEGAPARAEDLKGKGLLNMRAQRGMAAEDALANDPTYGPAVTARQADIPVSAIDTIDPTGKTDYDRRIQLERERGDQDRRTVAARAAAGGSESDLTMGQQLTAINQLSTRYQTNTRAAQMVQSQANLINDSWKRIETGQAKDLNASGQGILVTFQKVLDPISVVRESEYARSADGQAVLARLEGQYQRLSSGGPGMNRASLKEFVDTANVFARRARQYTEKEGQRIRKVARRYGLPEDEIFTDISTPEDVPDGPNVSPSLPPGVTVTRRK